MYKAIVAPLWIAHYCQILPTPEKSQMASFTASLEERLQNANIFVEKVTKMSKYVSNFIVFIPVWILHPLPITNFSPYRAGFSLPNLRAFASEKCQFATWARLTVVHELIIAIFSPQECRLLAYPTGKNFIQCNMPTDNPRTMHINERDYNICELLDLT